MYSFKLQEQISSSFRSETCPLISVQDGEHISSPPWQFFNRFLFALSDALWPSGNNYTVYYSDLWDCCGFQQKTTINIQLRPPDFPFLQKDAHVQNCISNYIFKKTIAQKNEWLFDLPAFVRNSKVWFWLLRFSKAKVYFRSQYIFGSVQDECPIALLTLKDHSIAQPLKPQNKNRFKTGTSLVSLSDECMCVCIYTPSVHHCSLLIHLVNSTIWFAQ